MPNVLWFKDILKEDIGSVGGKGVNLGIMYNISLPVPPGFVVTASAFKKFLDDNGLPSQIYSLLDNLDVEDGNALQKTAKEVQDIILAADMPNEIKNDIVEAYDNLNINYDSLKNISRAALEILKSGRELPYVAIRSSATAEDRIDASFAGQQETYLNIKGTNNVLKAVQKCWASLFTARAIYYRIKNNYSHESVYIAVVIQKQIQSQKSGVIFTINPSTNNQDEIIIETGWGLGEAVVSGAIIPDEYIIDKSTLKLKSKMVNAQDWLFTLDNNLGYTVRRNIPEDRKSEQKLNDTELKKLSELAVKIENHYGSPQDIEYAIEGPSIYIVQSRPVTTLKKPSSQKASEESFSAEPILNGHGASPGIAKGPVKILFNLDDLPNVQKGDILVAKQTNPDYVVAMKKASAIVTDQGGSTSHAAIVSRELGIPCFDGETIILTDEGFLSIKDAWEKINQNQNIKTLSFNLSTLKIEWKDILNVTKRKGSTCTVSVSQSGNSNSNIIKVTPEHKFLSVSKRRVEYEHLSNLLNSNKMVCIAKKIPTLLEGNLMNQDEAYLMGAMFSDGYWDIRPDGSGRTVFTQRINYPQKVEFINKVTETFKKIYNYDMKKVGQDYYYCYKKAIAEDFDKRYNNISIDLLSANTNEVFNYIAGFSDGDGNFVNRGQILRLSFDVRDTTILESLAISCMRLGMPYRVFKEGTNNRFFIYGGLSNIFNKTSRILPNMAKRRTGTLFFSARQLFGDIPIRCRKGIKSMVKKNCLISVDKIIKDVIPFIDTKEANYVKSIIESDFHMLRIKKINDNPISFVYNLEVEDNNNYVVFTDSYTPIVVKNCVVGTLHATAILKNHDVITVDGSSGKVYKGEVNIKQQEPEKEKERYEKCGRVETVTEVKVNVDLPDFAEKAASTENDGIGLLRLEMMIANNGIHPIKYIKDGHDEEYIELLFTNISKIASYFKGKPIWVRTSDFRTDEYKDLEGAEDEPKESNPMLGRHGIRRSLDDLGLLKAEFAAIKRLHDQGFTNIGIMLPFVISVDEVRKAKQVLTDIGLDPCENIDFGVMVETPAACQIIKDICEEGIDFISFGTNDLTQLTLGIDRNNEHIASLFSEMHPGVLSLIKSVIKTCKEYNVETSICGQAGSNEEMVEYLVKIGIDSISANIDAVNRIRQVVARAEKKLLLGFARRDYM